ncbi:MAG: hypothetical protein M3Y87_08985 [Myxococcota bacterium]|nr:hypothetical protein [Myxococcota bacterium]
MFTPRQTAAEIASWSAWLASARSVSGSLPVRRSICSSIGVMAPMSLPTFVTFTATIARGPPSSEPAVAICTFIAGRKPSSAIFMTRASASVVDARAGRFEAPRLSWSSWTVVTAASTLHRAAFDREHTVEERRDVELAERLPEHARWMLRPDRVVRNLEDHLALVPHRLARSRLGHLDPITTRRDAWCPREEVCRIKLGEPARPPHADALSTGRGGMGLHVAYQRTAGAEVGERCGHAA